MVRTHYLTKQKILLTEKDGQKYDIEKEKYYLDKSLIDGLKLDIRVDNESVDRLVKMTQDELTKKFGRPAAFGDVVWGVANKMSMDAMRKGDLGLLRSIQLQMAIYLHYSGKDGTPLRESSFEIELREYKKSDAVKAVTIHNTNQCCDSCKALKDKRLTLDEAINQKFLPCKACTYKMSPKATSGWCRCYYSPEISM